MAGSVPAGTRLQAHIDAAPLARLDGVGAPADFARQQA
jgi:hypothetical protein